MDEITVLEVRDFLRYSNDGKLDLALCYKLFDVLLEERDTFCSQVLIDCRGVHKSTSYQDLYEVMSYAGQYEVYHTYCLALLGRLFEGFEFSQFAEFVGQLKGLCVRAFLDEEKARTWLMNTTANEGECVEP
ncbi:MAG: hypothetical protein RhofKO_14290 [Rhodothermales bacterium]